jgi:hypothetical protein
MLSQITPSCPDFWQAEVWTSPAALGKVSLHVGSLKYGGASLREMAVETPRRQAIANFMLKLFNFYYKTILSVLILYFEAHNLY